MMISLITTAGEINIRKNLVTSYDRKMGPPAPRKFLFSSKKSKTEIIQFGNIALVLGGSLNGDVSCSQSPV